MVNKYSLVSMSWFWHHPDLFCNNELCH